MVNENSIRSQADIDADLKVIYGDARYVPITIDFQNHVIIVYFIKFSDWSCHRKRLLHHLHRKEEN